VAEIVLDKVRKVYPDGTTGVAGVDLVIPDGRLAVLVGPSGCGKTTLLRCVAGLEAITDGTVKIGDRIVNEVSPKDRDLAMVFQDYALYPQMSVYDNMAFSLKLRRMAKADVRTRVDDVARTLGLSELMQKKPGQLSGGQRQRVAMGRAIVREPQAFLMDEPLSNLDAKLRVSMRTSLQQLHKRLGTTTVYVTHDQIEAMTLGQRVAVMRDGKLQQVAAPQALYDEPANSFVAAFIGSPAMNLVEARLAGDSVSFGGFSIPLDRSRRPRFAEDGRVVLGVRPEALEDIQFAERGLPNIEVDVEVLEELGSDAHVFFSVEAEQVVIEDALSDEGEAETTMLADARDRTLLTARVDARTKASVGNRLRLAVDPARLYFFSPDTGESLLNGAVGR
jgi:multiple sugar transport system ATP-binding protein